MDKHAVSAVLLLCIWAQLAYWALTIFCRSICSNSQFIAGFRPLPSYKKKCLNELWPELISGIQLQTLSGHLIKKNVITIDDLTEINDCQSPAEKKNRLLLCILRGGERALDDFILCLREDTDDRAHTELGQTLRDALMHVRPQCGEGQLNAS